MEWRRILVLTVFVVFLSSQVDSYDSRVSDCAPKIVRGVQGQVDKVVNNVVEFNRNRVEDVKDSVNFVTDKVGQGASTISCGVNGMIGNVRSRLSKLPVIGQQQTSQNHLKIKNGVFSNSFTMDGQPITEVFVVYPDQKQPTDFFEETINKQNSILEECISSGNLFIAYQPARVEVEEDHATELEVTIAKDVMKDKMNAIIETLFNKYGKYILKATRPLLN